LSVAEKRSAIEFFENKVCTSLLLCWSGISKSSYYYKCLSGKRGRKPSVHTALQDGSIISNDSVAIAIRFILAEEFVCFGYDKITDDLRSNGFIINPKKTYRIMKEQRLLCGTIIRTNMGKRKFVQWRVQQADRPMQQLCMDIKYIHIHGEKRNALLLTVLDVYTRSIVGHVLWWRIRKEHVIWLLHKIFNKYQVEGITLRNDNGSQFIAHDVRDYLKDKEVEQEFIHVATPEENSFIESYHSIVEREVLQPRQFEKIETAIDTFKRWEQFYNNRRLHGSLGNKPPQHVFDKWMEKNNREMMMKMNTDALSTNGERKSLKIEESRLVDKIFEVQMFDTFVQPINKNSQTVLKNLSSL
jgi:transposase InsO family protein